MFFANEFQPLPFQAVHISEPITFAGLHAIPGGEVISEQENDLFVKGAYVVGYFDPLRIGI